jgi:anti-sigma factor RsiW
MTHEKYIEWIQLAALGALGELGDENRRILDAHLDGCADCRSEYDELVRLMSLVGAARTAEPTDEMLLEARRNLKQAIHRDTAARDGHPAESLWVRLVRGLVGASSPPGGSTFRPTAGLARWFQGGFGRVALAGTAAVAVGFFAGYLAFGRLAVQPGHEATRTVETGAETWAQSDQELGSPSYENVRFVDVDPRSGQVKIEYDMIRPVRLRANIEDERVQRMLAYTVLNEKNPGVKLQAIQTIDAYVEHPADSEVKKALIQALKTDESPGVRKHALYVLYKMPFDRNIKDACLFVLANDQNPGMRVAAINILAAATLDGLVTGKEVYDVLAEQAGEDDYMRIRQAAFMQEVNGNGD